MTESAPHVRVIEPNLPAADCRVRTFLRQRGRKRDVSRGFQMVCGLSRTHGGGPPRKTV